jgi:hypothetical protein
VIFLSCSDNISSIYTSGRKCNFQNKGCDAQHLQPVNINGWFWADGNKRIPPTNIPSRLTFWSRSGEQRKPQPDNYAGLKAGKLGEGFVILTSMGWEQEYFMGKNPTDSLKYQFDVRALFPIIQLKASI